MSKRCDISNCSEKPAHQRRVVSETLALANIPHFSGWYCSFGNSSGVGGVGRGRVARSHDPGLPSNLSAPRVGCIINLTLIWVSSTYITCQLSTLSAYISSGVKVSQQNLQNVGSALFMLSEGYPFFGTCSHPPANDTLKHYKFENTFFGYKISIVNL